MNKVLYIDIGTRETKIVETMEAKGTIHILKTAEMRDMSGFVSSSGRLQSMEGFCKSLRKILDDKGITTTKTRVCSSCFEMQHKNISSDFCGYDDCAKQFATKYGSTLMSCDWQYFGETIKNNAPVQQLFMTMCKRVLLKKFVECMNDLAGLKVLSVESDFTARANLSKLHKHDFETPTTCVVDVGVRDVNCQYFSNGALLATKKLHSALAGITNVVSSTFSVDQTTAIKMLYTVGVSKSLENGSTLAAVGINSNKYYELINKAVTEFVKVLQEDLCVAKIAYDSERICIVLSGGVLAIPGMTALIKDKLKHYSLIFAEVDTGCSTHKGQIVNSTGQKLSVKFGLCIGMMCRVKQDHPVCLINSPKFEVTANTNKITKDDVPALVFLIALITVLLYIFFCMGS